MALKLRRRKIILNVSDLWPLAAIELDALRTGSISHTISLYLEKYIYRNATLIMGQSVEIITHIRKIYPDKACYLYRNFPDHESTAADPIQRNDGKVKLFYAGLLGVAQGVLELCENIRMQDNVEFHIFGDGAEKNLIVQYIKKNPGKNIYFHGMIERSDLLKKLQFLDVAVVPLKKRIYGSVPSKIFEYSMLGLPILYFGGGEGEEIVSENGLGWVAPVENFNELNQKIAEFASIGQQQFYEMKKRILAAASAKFNIWHQIKSLIEQEVF